MATVCATGAPSSRAMANTTTIFVGLLTVCELTTSR